MALVFGQNTDIDAAAEKLVASAVKVTSSVTLSNPNAAGTIYIGNDNTVTTTTGYPLPAGQQVSIGAANIEDFDLQNIWVIGSTTNLVMGYIGS